MVLLFTLLCLLSAASFTQSAGLPACEVRQVIDGIFLELWDFAIDGWLGNTRSAAIATSPPNEPSMNGTWTYTIDFCKGVTLYEGNTTVEPPTSQGIVFGNFSTFIEVEPNIIPAPQPDPHYPFYTAYLRFIQTYTNGQVSAPCTHPRSSTLNIYCGGPLANCSAVPGSLGDECLDGKQNASLPGFCICSVLFNATNGGYCNGLEINLLSDDCPNSQSSPIPSPQIPGESPGAVVGIVFLVLFILLLVSCVGGYAYNYSVHAKRGVQAIPFYDTCTDKGSPSYSSAKPITTGGGTYGTV